jgi:RTX calcium-binding nonapeptide repeat (4 copies)/WD40-like Beta Propeller Repeat
MVRRALLLCFFVAVASPAAVGIPTPPLADSIYPRWYPDGTRIAVESNVASKGYRWEPFVIDVGTAAMRPATEADQPFPSRPPLLGPARSPDGTMTARIADDRLIVTSSDGLSRSLGEARGLRWLPTGRLLVGAAGDRAFQPALYLVDPATGDRSPVVQGVSVTLGFDVSPDGSRIVFPIEAGGPYWSGHVVYEASVSGLNRDLRRLSPTACSEPPLVASWRCFLGTDGPDRIVGTVRRDQVLAGAGDDVVRGGDGYNRLEGWWGDDDIASGSGNDVVQGGPGRDRIRTGAGWDLVSLGPGNDRVATGRSRDFVDAADGERDLVDCGPGRDSAWADPFDRLVSCESVRRF